MAMRQLVLLQNTSPSPSPLTNVGIQRPCGRRPIRRPGFHLIPAPVLTENRVSLSNLEVGSSRVRPPVKLKKGASFGDSVNW